MLQFDAPESKAAETLGVSPETLKTWRLGGKIPSYVYAKFGYKTLRYCLPLLRD
jgi:predicted site-specific integrase-resolvase